MTGHRGQGGHTRCRENQSPGHGRAEPPSSVRRPVWTEAQGGETNSPQPRRGEEKGLGMGGRGLGPRGRFRRGRSGVCVGPSSLRPETGLHCRQKPRSRPGRPPPGAARRARRLSSTAPPPRPCCRGGVRVRAPGGASTGRGAQRAFRAGVLRLPENSKAWEGRAIGQRRSCRRKERPSWEHYDTQH